MEIENKARLANIDLIKVIAIVWVLALHVGVWNIDFLHGNFGHQIPQYMMRLLSEGVPIFVMVNGFLLFKSKSFSLKKHARKMIKILILFVLWATILIFTKGLGKEKLTILLVLNYILTTSVGSKYTGVLWFLENLLAIYFIFPILKFVFDNQYKLFLLLFCIVAFFTVGINLLSVGADLIYIFVPNDFLKNIQFFLGRINPIGNGEYLFFMMLGGVILNNLDSIKSKRFVWIIIGLLAWIFMSAIGLFISYKTSNIYNEAFGYCSVFTLFILVGLFALTLGYTDKERWYNKIVTSMAKSTFGIYFIHTLFIERIIYPYIYVVYSDAMFIRILSWIGIYIISWIVTVLMLNIPYIRKLVIL